MPRASLRRHAKSKPSSAPTERAHPLRQQRHPPERRRAHAPAFGARRRGWPHRARHHQPARSRRHRERGGSRPSPWRGSTAPDPDLLPLAEPAAITRPSTAFDAYRQRHARAERAARRGGGHRRRGSRRARPPPASIPPAISVRRCCNSRGVCARTRETIARFSITAMAGDSSGWAKASACDLARSRPARAGPRRRPQSRPHRRSARIAAPAATP